MTQLAKQTIVQGDFCPWSKFGEVKAAHSIFFQYIAHLYGKHQYKKKKNQYEQAFYW